MQIIEIKHAGHSIGVVPDCGGGLAWFRSDVGGSGRQWSWFREAPQAATLSPLDLACFPLVPFSNRIADAQFDYAGQRYVLEQNFPPELHAIHGVGWQSAWRVEVQTESEITLRLDWHGGTWPWKFEAEIAYRLTERGLSCRLNVVNRGTTTMPSGLGWHPYFNRTHDVTLHAPAKGLVVNDGRMLPRHVDWQAPVLDALKSGQQLPIGLDNQLVDWTGTAKIDWPDAGHKLEVLSQPQTQWAVLFTPADQSFFCFEPVTHLTNAHNARLGELNNTGLVELAPGEAHRLTVHFQPTVSAARIQR